MLARLLLLFFFCPLASTVWAQQEASWQALWQEQQSVEEGEDAAAAETMELLQQLAEHPIDLNHTTREELSQLPFLSAQQVADLLDYVARHAPVRSLGELRMVASLDYMQLQLLPYFIYAREDGLKTPPTSLRSLLKEARTQLSLSGRLPFYEREGDRNGYLGYPYRHTLRGELSSSHYLRAGFVAAQDAGEPFLAGGNTWGYDAYSYYLQLRHLGPVSNVVVGKYRLSAGMGLVLGGGFQAGKLATLQSLGRQTEDLRPHASRSESGYLQGAAVQVALSPRLTATLFGSYRALDATLSADGTASTLIDNGYHRTPTEMQKKHNTHQTAAGGTLTYRRRTWHAGLTAMVSHLDRELRPAGQQLYRRYLPSGRSFFNASATYAFTPGRWSLSGETALDGGGALATLNTLSYQPSARLGLMALQRFYSYRYATLHGHAFGEGGRVQNESGLYVGGTWQPREAWHLSVYADWAYFPWARYRVSRSSVAADYLAEVSYQPGAFSLKARYRLHQREHDVAGQQGLQRQQQHNWRLALGLKPWRGLSATTQADGVSLSPSEDRMGWMLSERLAWKRRRWQLNLTAAYFDTPSYDTRLYAYERQLLHETAFPTYYGRGLRLALFAACQPWKRLLLQARAGHTRYWDREQIGSGLQRIDAPRATDLDLLLRYQY